MSKKKSNNKASVKKIIDRNQKRKVISEPFDIQVDDAGVTIEEVVEPPVKIEANVTTESPLQKKEDMASDEKKRNAYQLSPLTAEQRKKTIVVIKRSWPYMKDKIDLLNLLNMALIILGGEDVRQITLRNLNYYAYSSNNKNRYITFQIPKKKKGEFRTIDAPCAGLKMIQRALNLIFQIVYTPHPAVMGFVEKHSVVTNAKVHIGQKYVYNVDLKDFFPSITSGRLYARLKVAPFSLDEKIASLITDLCCYENSEHKNVLPQGAPTSPTITNFICESLDRKLTRLANAYGMKYTRYADDITFSSMTNLFAEDGKFCKSLRNIIENEEHFKINVNKTRLCHKGERQEVTGITVNEKLNTSRKYVKQLRTLIHNCEVMGISVAQRKYDSCYIPKTLRPGANIPHIENVIGGKLLYLKMVKGEGDATYKKLYDRFIKLELASKGMAQTTVDPNSINGKSNDTFQEQDLDLMVQDLNVTLDSIISNYG